MCFLAHVRGNHWTAFAIDSGNLQIHYSDSLQAPVPADLKSAIEWWLSNHFSLPFTWSSLEICEQSDSYSCGLFAANGLMHSLGSMRTSMPRRQCQISASRWSKILTCKLLLQPRYSRKGDLFQKKKSVEDLNTNSGVVEWDW
ncbi:hypothetical protein EV363DRAFT_782166 [Boletus edulis]|nr:hypothetical protein EV363DRAFT_782166 [Boletus edulis]